MSVSRDDWYFKQMIETMESNAKNKSQKTRLVCNHQPKAILSRSPSQEDILFETISDILYDNSMRIPTGDYVNLMNTLKLLKESKKA